MSVAKMVKIDKNAHEILRKVRDSMKERGINATFSDAIREMYRGWLSDQQKQERE